MNNDLSMMTANAVERLKQQICARCSELVVTAGAQELQVLTYIANSIDRPDFASMMSSIISAKGGFNG